MIDHAFCNYPYQPLCFSIVMSFYFFLGARKYSPNSYLRHLKFFLEYRNVQTILNFGHGFERKIFLTFQNL